MPSKETLDRRRDDHEKEQEKYEAFMNKRKKRLTGANVSPMVRLDGLQTTETSQVQSAPAAVDAPAVVAPAVKPKAKRKGWGGGLGSRLPRKDNPTVKNKPEPKVIADAPTPTAAAAPRRVSRDDSRSRDDYRERRPSSAPEEIIIDAVAATKYAKPIEAVNDENLDASLAELASGMLARAGFLTVC